MPYASKDLSAQAQELTAIAVQLSQRLALLNNVAVWAGADAGRFTLEYQELVIDKIVRSASRLHNLHIPDVV